MALIFWFAVAMCGSIAGGDKNGPAGDGSLEVSRNVGPKDDVLGAWESTIAPTSPTSRQGLRPLRAGDDKFDDDMAPPLTDEDDLAIVTEDCSDFLDVIYPE